MYKTNYGRFYNEDCVKGNLSKGFNVCNEKGVYRSDQSERNDSNVRNDRNYRSDRVFKRK